ncbi:MAG: response regulator transcription factor [Anaerolineae bacterium]|nr:response regulator transcription factor [Anaerolineae bacterium]
MGEEKIRIVLADDHAVLRAGLRALLNSEPDLIVVGEAGDGDEALHQVEAHQPQVLVLDLMMPKVKGLDIIDQLTAKYPHLRVLILSMHADTQYVRHVLKAGCAGYVTKSSADTELITAIHEVANGRSYLTPEVANVLLQDYRRQDNALHAVNEPEKLSDRESEVLAMTALGYSSREIGEILFISPKSVDTYRQRSMEKLHLESRAELVQYALKNGLLEAK